MEIKDVNNIISFTSEFIQKYYKEDEYFPSMQFIKNVLRDHPVYRNIPEDVKEHVLNILSQLNK